MLPIKTSILSGTLLLITLWLLAMQKHRKGIAIPEKWPEVTYNFKDNPIDPLKITIGRQLFYDPILSTNNSISCESCHSPFTAFAHTDHPLSHGIGDSIGNRNAPAIMNLAWQKSFMWDGAINHLDKLPLAPISHPKEMGSTIETALVKLNQSHKYRMLFYEAYGDSLINSERLLKSMSQFLLTLVSDNSKYDQVKNDKAVFTDQEARGYQLFKSNCSNCHQEPLFTNSNFENNGLPVSKSLNDLGRYQISQRSEDSFKFKVPTLRNIEYTSPYMHDGRMVNLTKVLKHYTSGIHHSSTLSPNLKNGIVLSSAEKTNIIAFLLTLSDPQFIFNPSHQYPKSPSK